MKPITSLQKLFLFPFALLAFALIISVQNAPLSEIETTLNNAISDGSIEANVSSIGKHSGRSVKLTVTNATNNSLKITVPAGTAYVPSDDKEQTLIQLEEEFFVLEPNAKKTHMIAAFCSEAHDRSPATGGKFKISKSTNKNLNKAIAHMKDKKIDKKSFQSIVWAITNGHPVSNIEARNPQTKEFRKYVADLMGQDDTWYTTPQRNSINGRRQIISETMTVSGEVQFPSDGTSIIRQEVIDPSGEVRFAMPPSTPRKSHNVSMKFSVRVRGWEAGNYTLRIMKDDVEIKSYPFVLS